MVKFYTSHCPTCKTLKMLMDKKEMEYEEIDNEDEYMKIANENSIMSMPFAEIDGVIYNTNKLQKYITKGEKINNEE